MEGAFRPGYSIPSDQKWKSELNLMKRDTYEINCHCQGGTITNINELSACKFEWSEIRESWTVHRWSTAVNKFLGTRIYNVFQESPLTMLLPIGFYFLGILTTLLFQRTREKCKNSRQLSDLENLIRKNRAETFI